MPHLYCASFTVIFVLLCICQPTEEEETVYDVQVSFTVKLVKFADGIKIKLIKEVRAQTEEFNLVMVGGRSHRINGNVSYYKILCILQAKKFVKSLPQEVKANVKKEMLRICPTHRGCWRDCGDSLKQVTS